MNNAVPTSPLLQQMGHPHSYPSLGQISNPYEQQPPGKELNKYASLKAVGKGLQDGPRSSLEICFSPLIFLSPIPSIALPSASHSFPSVPLPPLLSWVS